jgi:hypothetical protein
MSVLPFPLPLWEVWFWSTLSVPIPILIGSSPEKSESQQCTCNTGWVVFWVRWVTTGYGQRKGWPGDKRLRGHTKPSRVVWSSSSVVYYNNGLYSDSYTFWKITCDLHINGCRCNPVRSTGHLTYTRCISRCSWGVPGPDGGLRTVVRKKILHYHQLYVNHPDPISVFYTITVFHPFKVTYNRPHLSSRKGVVCFLSVGPGISYTFWVISFKNF